MFTLATDSIQADKKTGLVSGVVDNWSTKEVLNAEEAKKIANGIVIRPEVFAASPIASKIPAEYKATTPLLMPKVIFLETSMGSVGIQMYWFHAPYTCRNFYELCKNGFYDNTKIHRIVRDFIIQAGDPTGTGRGGKSIYGDTFPDEIHPGLKHTGAGIISMANSGKDTNASQFFITLAPLRSLDGSNVIFGRIHSGMGIIKRLSSVQTTAADTPIFDIKIIRTVTAICLS